MENRPPGKGRDANMGQGAPGSKAKGWPRDILAKADRLVRKKKPRQQGKAGSRRTGQYAELHRVMVGNKSPYYDPEDQGDVERARAVLADGLIDLLRGLTDGESVVLSASLGGRPLERRRRWSRLTRQLAEAGKAAGVTLSQRKGH